MSKFKSGDIVWFKLKGIKAGEVMVASLPKKYFKLDVIYVVKAVGEYTDGYHVLVHGSTQFVHEKYFKKSKRKKKYETITINNVEYFLIPKRNKKYDVVEQTYLFDVVETEGKEIISIRKKESGEIFTKGASLYHTGYKSWIHDIFFTQRLFGITEWTNTYTKNHIDTPSSGFYDIKFLTNKKLK